MMADIQALYVQADMNGVILVTGTMSPASMLGDVQVVPGLFLYRVATHDGIERGTTNINEIELYEET